MKGQDVFREIIIIYEKGSEQVSRQGCRFVLRCPLDQVLPRKKVCNLKGLPG